MPPSAPIRGTFTSKLERIAEFLYRPENINHQGVVYMNFVRSEGIFEHPTTGSTIYLAFTEDDEVSTISFSLSGEEGILHRWIRMFQQDFGAAVESTH